MKESKTGRNISNTYSVGIIGCGLIGNKRAASLIKFDRVRLLQVADTNPEKALALSQKYSCAHSLNWKDVTHSSQVGIVIVSTINNTLAEITLDAIKNGKHVIVEKPAGISIEEIRQIIKAYELSGKKQKIKVGFNHRFHPAIQKAKEIIEKEGIGEIMFIRARYGHGGRLGYNKEWRAVKALSGGGEMLDQGSHLIDLSRYFLGDFCSAIGYCGSLFWDMEVEDNCFALLKTEKKQVAQLHASCTQWKNLFSFEISCKQGLICIEGLGGSYGRETLTFYRMRPEMGIPDKSVFEYDSEDDSFAEEFQDLLSSIEKNIEPNGNIYDAYENMKIVKCIYNWNDAHGHG